MSLVSRPFKKLHEFCFILGEVRSLLVDFAVGMSSRISAVRKITPVLAQTETTSTLTDKQLQVGTVLLLWVSRSWAGFVKAVNLLSSG